MDARRTSGRQGLEARPTTQDGQGLEARPKPTTQGVDTRRTSGGQEAEARSKPTRRTSGGHMADKLQRRGEHVAASLFFLRENLTVNCLGKKPF